MVFNSYTGCFSVILKSEKQNKHHHVFNISVADYTGLILIKVEIRAPFGLVTG
jgi:hypothetical protein